MKNFEIKLWMWNDAPQEVKDAYEKSDVWGGGGDEDYVLEIKLPDNKDEWYIYPQWIEHLIDKEFNYINGLGEPHIFQIGDVYYNVFEH